MNSATPEADLSKPEDSGVVRQAGRGEPMAVYRSRAVQLNIRFNETERELLERAAAAEGLSLTGFMRHHGLRAARAVLAAPGPLTRALEDMSPEQAMEMFEAAKRIIATAGATPSPIPAASRGFDVSEATEQGPGGSIGQLREAFEKNKRPRRRR